MTIGVRGWAVLVAWAVLVSCGENGGPEAEAGTEEAEGEPAAHVLARKDHRHPDGTVVTSRHALRLTEASMTVEQGGERRLGTMTMTTERELQMETLGEDARRVEVVKDAQSVTRTLDGVPEKSPSSDHVLLGQPVMFSRVDGEWVGALAAGEASEDQQAEIAALASDLGNREAVEMFGTSPRRPGDEWEIDPQNAAVLGSGAEFSGTYRLRFDRIEEYDGERCAVLAGQINVSSESAEGPFGGSRIEIVAEATVVRSLAHLVTRRLEISGTLVMRETPGPGESLVVRGPLKISRESTVTLP